MLRLRGGGELSDTEEMLPKSEETGEERKVGAAEEPEEFLQPVAKKKPTPPRVAETIMKARKDIKVGDKMIIKTGERRRLMSAIKVRPNGEVDGVEVAHADSKEELDILLARERLRTLEEDTKIQLGEKERMNGID